MENKKNITEETTAAQSPTEAKEPHADPLGIPEGMNERAEERRNARTASAESRRAKKIKSRCIFLSKKIVVYTGTAVAVVVLGNFELLAPWLAFPSAWVLTTLGAYNAGRLREFRRIVK